MRTFEVTITGKTPLLMHYDNIEWADFMQAWQADPANKQKGAHEYLAVHGASGSTAD